LRFPGFSLSGKQFFFAGVIEGGFEHPELLVAHDSSVVLFGFDEAGGGPTKSPRAVLPVRDAARSLPYAAVSGVDEVGGAQAASQGGREVQAADGEYLVEPLAQAGGGVGPVAFEPFSVLLQL
jgi:hypothetical protein